MEENIPEPTFTQTPNVVFDVIQKRIDPHGFSILMVIVRKTYGYHKSHDSISNSQIESQTGFTRPTVTKHAAILERLRLIVIIRSPGRPARYSFGQRFKRLSDAYTMRQLKKRIEEPGNNVSTSPRNGVATYPETGFPTPGNGVSPPNKSSKQTSKKPSSPKGDKRSLTELHDEELTKTITYILETTGTSLKPDKWLKIWWYNAIKLDGLNNLKWAVRNYCESKINREMGKWDWVGFFSKQAKRASYLPKDGNTANIVNGSAAFAGRTALHSDSGHGVSDEEFAAHMAARDAG